MTPFTTLHATCVSLRADNVDTDQIIPARFLTTTSRDGLGAHLFADWRYDATGQPLRDFPLNHPDATEAAVLVAGANFGCGSSREHAVWALQDFGFRAVLGASFADIFRSNAFRNGLLAVQLPADVLERLHAQIAREPSSRVTVDLETQMVALPDGSVQSFEIDPFARHCLLEGVDALDWLLRLEPGIARFESTHARATRVGGPTHA